MNRVILGCLLVACIALANAGLAKDETRIVERILNAAPVQQHIRPRPVDDDSAPVDVRLNLYVRHIERLDSVNGVWKIQLTFRQEWNDSRLAFRQFTTELNHITLTTPNIIWTPDVFFSQELEGKVHSVHKPQILIRISPEGEVLHSSRITVILACPELVTGQEVVVCPLRIVSYGYTREDVTFNWREDPVVLSNRDLILENNSPYTLQQDGVNTTLVDATTITGIYSSALASFTFTKGNANKCKV